ncbi:AraC family transcriptional regulator [Emticicia sp. C21]|uniref:AraC family transcriptional regulator n=1 Tax=Emticicia sp. C21 TaxID=2302915 RepID=UPI00286D7162|nr:AraC family transcriptional regulator [Emticicia sp. C21]
MIFKRHIPQYPMSQYIEHIIYAKGSQPMPYLMELPDGRINLIIELEEKSINTLYSESNFEGKRTMKHGWVSGANAKAITYQNNNNSAIISIRFTVGGFYALTKIPMSELIYPGLEIELLLGSSFNRLYQTLINEEEIENKFQHIQHYFQKYITDNSFNTSVVKFIDKNIDKPIDWLVNKSGYSQKHLIHILKKQTGFSPKYLQRLQRFHKVINAIQQAKGQVYWSSIVYDHEYFDQAHFIKEFIHFTGISPLEYFKINNSSEHHKVLTDIILF